ncbi:hypothetical protein ACFLZP_05125 [Patescibacteria group bacterium]
MLKKDIPLYSAVLIIYLSIISLLYWQLSWAVVLLWLGASLGLVLYNLDHLAYLLWQVPGSQTALEFRRLLVKGDFKNGFSLLEKTCYQRDRLVGHSVVFQLVLMVLTLFTLSSTVSPFGKGLVMGLFLYSLINQGLLLLRGKSIDCWFWQLKMKLGQAGEAFYFIGVLFVFFFFSRLLI